MAFEPTERFQAVIDDKPGNPKRVWAGYRFSDEECEALARGEYIEFDYTSKAGKLCHANGCLKWDVYTTPEGEEKPYLGFANEAFAKSEGVPDHWSVNKLTSDEIAMLEAGQDVFRDNWLKKDKSGVYAGTIRYGEPPDKPGKKMIFLVTDK